jgi:hypothetical protein
MLVGREAFGLRTVRRRSFRAAGKFNCENENEDEEDRKFKSPNSTMYC